MEAIKNSNSTEIISRNAISFFVVTLALDFSKRSASFPATSCDHGQSWHNIGPSPLQHGLHRFPQKREKNEQRENLTATPPDY
jgi:hypothetical protein